MQPLNWTFQLKWQNHPISRDQAYGCQEDSEAPICRLGRCVSCTTDAQCADRPGNANICHRPSGRCVVCVADRQDEDGHDWGCGSRLRPRCYEPGDGPAYCAECSGGMGCDDTSVCVGGRCEICDPNTGLGCTRQSPICREGLDENLAVRAAITANVDDSIAGSVRSV